MDQVLYASASFPGLEWCNKKEEEPENQTTVIPRQYSWRAQYNIVHTKFEIQTPYHSRESMHAYTKALLTTVCTKKHNLNSGGLKWNLTSTKVNGINPHILLLGDKVFTVWPLKTFTKNNRDHLLKMTNLHAKYENSQGYPSWDTVFTSKTSHTHIQTHKTHFCIDSFKFCLWHEGIKKKRRQKRLELSHLLPLIPVSHGTQMGKIVLITEELQ